MVAVGGFVYAVVDIGEQLACGDGAIFVVVGFAVQTLQEEEGEDAVASAPFVGFVGELADVAGGDYGAIGIVGEVG